MRCAQGPYFTETKGYPASPKTIGAMIRKRRLDLGLRQIDVAKIIGCDEMSVVNWEKGYNAPRVNHLAGIVAFLGLGPLGPGDTISGPLVNFRKARGSTQKAFALRIGADQATLARWERGERVPTGDFLRRVDAAVVAPNPSQGDGGRTARSST